MPFVIVVASHALLLLQKHGQELSMPLTECFHVVVGAVDGTSHRTGGQPGKLPTFDFGTVTAFFPS